MTQTEDSTVPSALAAEAVGRDGWRLVLGNARTSVEVSSPSSAVEVAAAALRACGPDAARLRVDLRADRVELVLGDPTDDGLRPLDTTLAARISAAVAELGLSTGPGASATRPVQALEIAVDALDIPAVAPFWAAVLGYATETRPIAAGQVELALVDPVGQGPAIWFQQLDAPRPQRNRIHFDVSVGEDEAGARVAAALAAGGRLVSDARAKAFWILADPEGNEVCVCTWQDRD